MRPHDLCELSICAYHELSWGKKPKPQRGTKRHKKLNHSLLAQVGTLHIDPLLEEIALRSLNDDDPEVAANAAGFLGRFGSAATEEKLWERLAQWSAQWHGRESELIYIAGGTNANAYQGTLGTSLQQAISTGEAWLADKAKLQKLQQLSVGTSMRQSIDGTLAQWDHKPWRIQFLHFLSGPQFDVLQYHLNSLDFPPEQAVPVPAGFFLRLVRGFRHALCRRRQKLY